MATVSVNDRSVTVICPAHHLIPPPQCLIMFLHSARVESCLLSSLPSVGAEDVSHQSLPNPIANDPGKLRGDAVDDFWYHGKKKVLL